jgi:methyl-accepting chemotaxis protein
MNLRTRILLGYWYLVGLLVLSAAAAALGFHSLGTRIGTVLDENFESVRASMGMLEALERQDSAMLELLLGDAASRRQMEQAEAAFQESFARARGNLTIAKEAPVLQDIEHDYSAYRAARDTLLGVAPERPLAAYEATAYPLFEAVKKDVYELLDVNHQAMVDADQHARDAANLHALGHGVLVVLALLSLAYLSQGLERGVLRRLAELRDVAQAIADGDRSRRAVVGSGDELGVVARQLNGVLDQLAEAEGRLQGRLQEQRQLLLGMVAALDRPGAIFTLNGTLVASTLADHDLATAERGLTAVRAATSADEAAEVTEEVDTQRVTARLLAADGVRPVGWLVTVR